MRLRPDDGLTTRIITEEPEWDAIKGDWDGLFARSLTASTALDFAWQRSWWHVYRRTLQCPSLRIITVWQGSRLVGALPLFIHRSRRLGLECLRFISTGEAEFEETCPDYLNLLAWTGEEERCAALVWRAIGRLSWDDLQFVNLAADTPLLRAGIVTTGAQALSTSSGTCPVADLSGGFEAYLRRLSSHGRKRARSLLREGARAGVRLEIADVHECQAAFDDLMRLHQARWRLEAKPGVFAAPRFVEFHRRLITGLDRRALIARMVLGNTPVAAVYGFVIGSKFDFYQSGVDFRSAASLESPGILAHLLLMQALVDRGLTVYDFLGGAAPYKRRLATGENKLLSFQVWRPTIRTTAYRSAALLGQIFRTGLLRKK